MKTPVIAIIGPTALGKSDLAVFIAKKTNGEIVSADSRQVYKGMNIGTGKITPREARDIPHHMLDTANPLKRISVAQYVAQACRAIDSIARRGHIPVVCGGTGFYVEELLFPSTLPPVKTNKKLRRELSKLSAGRLFKMLEKKDPDRASNIDSKNKVRLIRALEIVYVLGKVPKRQSLKSPYEILIIELDAPIDFIRKKIHARLLKRIKSGLMAEVRRLHKNGLSFKAFASFGLEYKWGAKFLQKKITRDEFLKGLEKDIAQFARRQKLWFKKMREKHKNTLVLNAKKEYKRLALAKVKVFLETGQIGGK